MSEKEIAAFERTGIWKGGFYNGERLQLFSDSEIKSKGTVLNQRHSNGPKFNKETYFKGRDLREIRDKTLKPFIDENTTVLEIGPGRGSWTKTMLNYNPKHIYCFDVFTAEHNNFWGLLGNENKDRITYFKVHDHSCKELEDDSIDFVFSYDVFCHISYSGTREYLKNLYPKLKKGAKCIIMIADREKNEKSQHPFVRVRAPKGTYGSLQEELDDIDGPFYGGRWYYYGIDRFCESLEEFNYTVLNRDLDLDSQNPICFFQKN